MSLHDYKVSQEINAMDPPFYSLIMAAARRADDANLAKLKRAWPCVVQEFAHRYHAPGGVLEKDITP